MYVYIIYIIYIYTIVTKFFNTIVQGTLVIKKHHKSYLIRHIFVG